MAQTVAQRAKRYRHSKTTLNSAVKLEQLLQNKELLAEEDITTIKEILGRCFSHMNSRTVVLGKPYLTGLLPESDIRALIFDHIRISIERGENAEADIRKICAGWNEPQLFKYWISYGWLKIQ